MGLPDFEAMEAFVQYKGYLEDEESPYFTHAALEEL